LEYTGPPKRRQADGKSTSLTLRHLSQEKTYRVWMLAEAEAGYGPETRPLYANLAYMDGTYLSGLL